MKERFFLGMERRGRETARWFCCLCAVQGVLAWKQHFKTQSTFLVSLNGAEAKGSHYSLRPLDILQQSLFLRLLQRRETESYSSGCLVSSQLQRYKQRGLAAGQISVSNHVHLTVGSCVSVGLSLQGRVTSTCPDVLHFITGSLILRLHADQRLTMLSPSLCLLHNLLVNEML